MAQYKSITSFKPKLITEDQNILNAKSKKNIDQNK